MSGMTPVIETSVLVNVITSENTYNYLYLYIISIFFRSELTTIDKDCQQIVIFCEVSGPAKTALNFQRPAKPYALLQADF